MLAVVFWIVSIVDCAVQPDTRHRGVSKGAWVAITVVLPIVGGLLWFLLGRAKPVAATAVRRAPDDDPDFLGSVGGMSAAQKADQDARIRRLEEELARLDEETDPPTPPKTDGQDGEDDTHGSRGIVG